MRNYASGASSPKAAGEQFAEGEAAGARPPFQVIAALALHNAGIRMRREMNNTVDLLSVAP